MGKLGGDTDEDGGTNEGGDTDERGGTDEEEGVMGGRGGWHRWTRMAARTDEDGGTDRQGQRHGQTRTVAQMRVVTLTRGSMNNEEGITVYVRLKFLSN